MSCHLALSPADRERKTRRTPLLACSLLLVTALLGSGTAHARAERASPSDAADQARITAVRQLDARVLDLTVSSPAMGTSVPVRVILPRDWYTEPQATFPVLYMLHGGDDDYTSWTRETDIEALAERSDVLVVMPDAGRAGYYSDWRVGRPRWETFHTVELVRLMERDFRANASRAVVGLSMGGFGALNYAAHHPGMFRYVASMSSYVDLDDPAARLSLLLGSRREGTDLKDVWGDPGENADIWRAHNPSAMPAAFRGTTVHLSAGNGAPGPWDANRPRDALLASTLAEAVLPRSTKRFASSLRASGVSTTTHFYAPGTHSWPYWKQELHRIWPAIEMTLESGSAGSGTNLRP
ncbi:alpha/beta hydrolase family protein [Streptomyces sp. H51]|uniref:alpha/beta hydrolase n=1 Tax=Streptomyces sp. H51 TaxID=3111770 RepID=UPI002D7852BB|nr:alpha/beta hydrolase family protein [Streptomyces sp. H51]